jgi:hypothetical protein
VPLHFEYDGLIFPMSSSPSGIEQHAVYDESNTDQIGTKFVFRVR